LKKKTNKFSQSSAELLSESK